MKKFDGFPARMEFTPLPNLFFSALLPRITDIYELKVTLHVMAALYRKRGYPRFVTFGELLGDAALVSSLDGSGGQAGETLRRALEAAAERGTLLHLEIKGKDATEDIYFLNNESNRQTVDKIRDGEIRLNGISGEAKAPVATAEMPDIFSLYEQNIGMLTPIIADELREAEKLYPPEWLRDAVKEAVRNNKRKWSYISAILERWSAEGKKDGTYQRHPEKTDPDRFIKGKYGHMVRR